jgi:hypothetical protein
MFMKVVVAVALVLGLAEIAVAGPIDGCAKDSDKQGFGSRFVDTYKDYLKWDGDPADTPQSWRQGLQPPMVSSPPMPFGNVPLGGSENIGYENMYYGAFMDAVYCGPNGQAWKDTRVTTYGWLNVGGNLSTSKNNYNFVNGTGGNFPASYSYQPNTVQLDQFALYFERTPDMVQTDHFDWGFRVGNVYGTDYKYTFSRSLMSDQYTQSKDRMGFDTPMLYGELYFPKVAQGLNVRIGRYISVPDIEAQLAPNNYNYSHSLLYSFDPYTQEGIVGTLKLTKNWTVQAEVSVGNDVAFWNKTERKLTPAVCVQWTSDSGKDVIYPCINGSSDTKIGNNGVWGWNNLQHEVITWYHKFDDKWHISSEFWHMYQRETPNVNDATGAGQAQYLASPQVAGLNIGAPFGAQCNPGAGATCRSKEFAFVNYIVYQPGPRDFLTLRSGFFNDQTGQRTGFATRYVEEVLGYNHWIGKAITIRPELRFERAIDVPAYSNPTQCNGIGSPFVAAGSGVQSNAACAGTGKNNQWMFAIDAIVHF